MTDFNNTYPVNIPERINRISSRYNPEWDLPNNDSPPVTWAESDLADCVRVLTQAVYALEDEVKKLRDYIYEMENK